MKHVVLTVGILMGTATSWHAVADALRMPTTMKCLHKADQQEDPEIRQAARNTCMWNKSRFDLKD